MAFFNKYQKIDKNREICPKNIRQQSVDMGLILGKNMGGWVVFFIFGPHTPVTFLDKYLPRGFSI